MTNETDLPIYPAEIIKAIHEVKNKVEYVEKDGNNTFHKYKYASEAALIEALRPAIQEAGLVIIPSGKELRPIDEHGNTHIVMSYTLTHISGAVWPEKLTAYGSGGDKSSKGTVGDKGVYKALTGLNKYFLRQLFQIETGTDPEKDGTKAKATNKKNTTTSGGTAQEKPEAAKDPNDRGDGLPFFTKDSKGRQTQRCSPEQVVRFHAIKNDFEWSDTAAISLLGKYGYTSTKDMDNWEDYSAICKELQKGMDGKATADSKGYCTFANGKTKERK